MALTPGRLVRPLIKASRPAYVRTDCGAGGYSTWSQAIAFTTPCLPANVPYTMDLVNVTAPAPPTCVTAQTLNSGNTWQTVNGPGYGFNGNAMQYSWNSSLPADTWFYTQGLNLTGVGISGNYHHLLPRG